MKQRAESHLAPISAKIAERPAMPTALAPFVSDCAGDDRPDCPILEGLAQPGQWG